MTSINGADHAPDLPAPVVKCGCGFTLAGYLSNDSTSLLAQHQRGCPKNRRDLSGLWIALIVAIIPAAWVIVRIWGH